MDITAIEQLLQTAAGPTSAFVWGALWGSFFNVVIVRIPAGLSVWSPPSHCPQCEARIRWYDNLPLLSYLLLRGRCRNCNARFSPRYLLVETIVAVLALTIFVQQLDTSAALSLRLSRFLILSLFCGLLVAIAMIDIDTHLIPNVITYPAIPVCTGLSLFLGWPHWWDGLVGAAAGYLVIRAIADGYRLLTGRLGMGYGDAKLLAMIGAMLGWQVLLPTLLLASLQGSLLGITLLLIARAHQRRAAKQRPEQTEQEPLRLVEIAFGPYIALAGIEVLLLRAEIMQFFPQLS
ncbi:MAG: prepilin peptidase [Deltaproteobacteria bacterium]|nr:prepilin peptidase [Deltaproteobacteria bacterium]